MTDYTSEVPIQPEWYSEPVWRTRIEVTTETPDRYPLGPESFLQGADRVAHVDITASRDNGDVASLRGLAGYTVMYPTEDRPTGLLVVGLAIDPHATIVNMEHSRGRDRWWTAAQAEEAGYTIDRTCYPWVAYRGPRFAPFTKRNVVTPAVLGSEDLR